MFLVATLCENRARALQILREIPDNSVILFPETLTMISKQIIKYSKEKKLFIIYQSDSIIDDEIYVTFRAVYQGKELWQVKKFNLWHTDKNYYYPSKPEPFVTIRGRKAGVYICYDAVTLFKDFRQLIDNQIELLMIPANWDFNFELMDRITDFALSQVPCLKCCVFSNSNTVAYVKSQDQNKRILNTGFAEFVLK